jgi:trans-aconitate 2-methyltransferase
MASDWNPKAYLDFARERALPSADLVARIALEAPGRVLDVGCGPGNSAEAIAKRWPGAAITGIDSSEAMIEKAREAHPEWRWIVADASSLVPDGPYDLVFSNATLQWIGNHEALLSRLYEALAAGGALAVQFPRFDEMPASRAMLEAGKDSRWKDRIAKVALPFTYHGPEFYYDLFRKLGAAGFETWTTEYAHVMEGHRMITTMLESTGLRPHLAALSSDAERVAYLDAYTKIIEREYPLMPCGTVIFPFRRLFFIARKAR